MRLNKYLLITAVTSIALFTTLLINAETYPLSGEELLNQTDRDTSTNPSPIRIIEQDQRRRKIEKEDEFRTIDGSHNYIQLQKTKVADTQLIRLSDVA